MKKLLVSLMAVFAIANISVAQEAAIKWNPLYLGLGSVNLGIEFSVAPKWTLAFEGNAVIFTQSGFNFNCISVNDSSCFHILFHQTIILICFQYIRLSIFRTDISFKNIKRTSCFIIGNCHGQIHIFAISKS